MVCILYMGMGRKRFNKMKPISEIMPVIKKGKITNERAYIVSIFKDNMPSLSVSRIAYLLSPFKDLQDLYFLLNQCKHANNFTSLFIWKTKTIDNSK